MNLLLKKMTCLSQGELLESHNVYIEDGVIRAVGKSMAFNYNEKNFVVEDEGSIVVPGFIDLQVNGGRDIFFTNSITKSSLETIYHDHLAYGSTSILPTIVSTSFENMLTAISVVKSYWADGKQGVLGLHLEGPYLNMDKKGAHNPKYIRKPTNHELTELLQKGNGIVKMMTIAPELFTSEQMALIRNSGIIIAVGHTNLSDSQARDVFSRGVNCVTHLYNAMSAFHSRECGLVGAALDSCVYASVVADGFHCSMTALRLAHRLKKGKLFLVSDATFIGTNDLTMDGIVFSYKDGVYINEAGNLAGSNITMIDAVRIAYDAGLSLVDAIQMATSIPGELIGLSKSMGDLVPGNVADLVILDRETLNLKMIIKNGQIIDKVGRRRINS